MISLRNRLWIGFGSMLMILLVVSALTLIVFTRYSHALERVFRENYDSAVYCDAMKESLDRLNTRAQEIIWDDPDYKNIDVADLESQFQFNVDAQLQNVTLPGEMEASRNLAGLWEQYREHYQAFDEAKAGKPDLYKQDLLPRYAELRQLAQHVADMNMSNMISVDGKAKRTLLHVRNALLVLVIVGTILAGIVVWTAGLQILRPLKDFTRSARQIEEGNLDLNLPKRSQDEIGELTEAFNSMVLRLREFKQIDHDRLVRSRQTTQLAIDSLPDAVFVIGPGDKIEISNDAARTYFGIEPGLNVASLGLHWLDALYDNVKRHGKPVEAQGYKSAIQLFVGGEERFLLPKAVPMLSADHRPLGVTAILVDVTQLRRVDEAKSSLISTVSHELRTPLTSQQLLLGLLLTTAAPSLPPNQRKMLEVAKADSDRLYRTIDELLSLSRMESGRMQFQFRDLKPRNIVMSSVDPLRVMFADKLLRLKIEVGNELPAVRADPVSVNSALTNLLSNALKFTPAGGEVTVSAEENGDHVLFSVADSGPGIPSEFRARIFEKFFRVPAPAGPSGAGLGLNIAKNIIEAHGGQIEFICPDTGGTIFRFQIPMAAQFAQAQAD
jgi:two-component system, NtrC family, sensor histidine kinase KinB